MDQHQHIATSVRRRPAAHNHSPKQDSVTFVETDADGNMQVFVFTSPPPPDFYCPLTAQILSNPVMTPCGHTFSRAAVVRAAQSTGRCPICDKAIKEADLKPNLLARTMVEELEVHCPYGVQLSGGSWVEDPDGCPDTYKLGLRKAKLKACKYRPSKCPYGGKKCGLIPRIDLDYHVREECRYLHKRDGKQEDEGDWGLDTLEVLTLLLVWGLLLFGLYQTHFFRRLMLEAGWHLSILLGIPVTLAFVAILAEYFMYSSDREPPDEYVDDEDDQ